MSNLYRKILSTSILNALSAAINFLSNLLIVKVLSIQIFGEFAIFTSFLAFGGLLYIVIPPNYSVFKLQDSLEFKKHLIQFFILSSLAFSLFALISNLFVFQNINTITIIVFGISTYCLNFFDIKFQASGLLQKYFVMLFILSLLKIILLCVFYFANLLNTLSGILWAISIGQSIILVIYLYDDRKLINNILISPFSFIETLRFIKNNFTSFAPYYINTILKRIRENSIILIFSRTVSTETMGLFALFIKVDSFVLGLSRNIEALFMNRENINEHRSTFYQKAIYFGFILQLLYCIVGVIYMKIIANNYFWIEIFIQSLLVYPHIYFLLARAELLSNFNNKESNFSELIYVSIIICSFFLSITFHLNTIYLLLGTYIIAKFGLQLFMILKNRGKYDTSFHS